MYISCSPTYLLNIECFPLPAACRRTKFSFLYAFFLLLSIFGPFCLRPGAPLKPGQDWHTRLPYANAGFHQFVAHQAAFKCELWLDNMFDNSWPIQWPNMKRSFCSTYLLGWHSVSPGKIVKIPSISMLLMKIPKTQLFFNTPKFRCAFRCEAGSCFYPRAFLLSNFPIFLI